jgi:membrane protein DedA with SNARE-associated domain
MRNSSSNSFSYAAIALGVIGLLVVPILFGGIGIVLAAIAKSKGEKKAVPALIFTIVATVLGLIIGAIIGAAAFG